MLTRNPSPPPEPTAAPPTPTDKLRGELWARWERRRRTRKTPDHPCRNCGDPTRGFYCPSCGQRKVEVRVSLRRMLMEFLDDQLALSSALPRTLGALFFRPGHLTHEYVHGRIIRYIPPLRLYLFASLVFFVTLPFVTDFGRIAEDLDDTPEPPSAAELEEAAQRLEEAERTLAALPGPAGQSATQARLQLEAARQAAETARAVPVPPSPGRFQVNLIQFGDTASLPGWLKPTARMIDEKEDRLEAMPPREAIRTLVDGAEENAPKVMFLILPVFALLLKLLYARRKRFYVEHFVFALHVHAFAFLLFTVMLVTPVAGVSAVLGTWLLLYVFLAMKRVYGQGIVKTGTKYFALGWGYLFSLVLGTVVLVLLTALSV